jgi:hypothetical protein
MSETLFDFSKKISENEFVTEDKIQNLVDSIHIEKIVCKNFGSDKWIKNYVITFPKKIFFFTVLLYGGGSSGIKLAYDSRIALGGYSSGTIVRFPIEIKNNNGNVFGLVRVGKGGDSFSIEDKVLWNNGEFSNFDLISGSGDHPSKSFQTKKGRKVVDGSGGSILLEGLSCYGGGKLLDGSIIEETSTLSYFGFKGSNPTNTFKIGTGEHRNYYAPYLSEYDGYHSLNGLGGDHLGNVDGEEDTGAGGAGVINESSTRVGKGGNGACIIEYEGKEKIEIFAVDYLQVNSNGYLAFDIQDSGNNTSRVFKFLIPEGVYSILYLISYIKNALNETVDANVLEEDSRLLIKMDQPWNINLSESDGELIFNLGISNSDVVVNNELQISKFINGSYQKHFTNSILSVCPLNVFGKNKVYD